LYYNPPASADTTSRNRLFAGRRINLIGIPIEKAARKNAAWLKRCNAKTLKCCNAEMLKC
jgi:hypothetical protein